MKNIDRQKEELLALLTKKASITANYFMFEKSVMRTGYMPHLSNYLIC
ncbi:MAG: hypothetical protein ACI87I_001093 [Pseudoalteromonas tetraodonis]|jgi:hypothetical protein